MLALAEVGAEIARRRKAQGLSQTELARMAALSRASVESLENGRAGELGYTKVAKLLAVLGLEFKIERATLRRPTLEELRAEERDDQSLERHR